MGMDGIQATSWQRMNADRSTWAGMANQATKVPMQPFTDFSTSTHMYTCYIYIYIYYIYIYIHMYVYIWWQTDRPLEPKCAFTSAWAQAQGGLPSELPWRTVHSDWVQTNKQTRLAISFWWSVVVQLKDESKAVLAACFHATEHLLRSDFECLEVDTSHTEGGRWAK